ncbi:MAG: hypothetical protein L6420_09180 [Elusimicrobia bacterium]|nr:hypothetical protein [Elusimicrobiota bacterium]
MTIIFCLALFLIFPLTSFAQDDVKFNIFAGTNSEDIKIHFVLTDSLGRRTGYLPEPGNDPSPLRVANLQEIPNTFYDTERLWDEEAGDVGSDESIQFYSHPVIAGTYTITVFAFADTTYYMSFEEYLSIDNKISIEFKGFMSSGTTLQYATFIDPTKPIPFKPIITKTVTFQLLRDDVNVAYKLNQIGDDKFVDSLIRMINLAERLVEICDNPKGHDKSKGHKKDKVCKPAIAVLNMFIKRLEIANRKCDNKPQFCDEEPAWLAFRKEHGKDKNFKDFFKEWDKDKWHKWKNKCKRFVTDEALNIIRGDAEILIQDLGGKVKPDKKEKKTKNNEHD